MADNTPTTAFRRIYVDLPTDLSVRFRQHCVGAGISQNAAVRMLITEYLTKGSNENAKSKKR